MKKKMETQILIINKNAITKLLLIDMPYYNEY